MSPDPDDHLARLFAAEEQAIRDDGFSQRVAERAGKGLAVRQFAIYGSALAGLGFAVGGVAELSPHLINVTGWVEGVVAAAESVDVGSAVQGASEGAMFVVVALAAGITCLLTAVSMQNR